MTRAREHDATGGRPRTTHHIFRLLLFAMGIASLSPLTQSARLEAQQSCQQDDPPCPPPPPLTMGVQAPSDTVRGTSVTVAFGITGIGTGTLTVTATLDGVPTATPSWHFDPNGASVSGWVQVAPTTTGAHTVVVTVCEAGRSGPCPSDSVTVLYRDLTGSELKTKPLVAIETGAEYMRTFGGCAGCAYTTLSYSTPSYRSLDQERAVTLLYSSATSAPMGMVTLDVNPNSMTPPDSISLSLTRLDGSPVTLTSGGTEVFYRGGAGMSRVSAQFDASAIGTNWYGLYAHVKNWWGTESQEAPAVFVWALILNERTSPYGSGWRVAGVPLLGLPYGLPNDAVIIEDERMTIYRLCPSGTCWMPPPGRTDTLFKVSSTLIQLRHQDGTVIDFNAGTGLAQEVRDRIGNATSFLYDGYARLREIHDPAGQVTTIAWSNPPGIAGTATITTPGGRASVLRTDAAGHLVDIIDPDGVRALFVEYVGNHLVAATGRNGGTMDYTYDLRGGLATVVGPPVQTDDRGLARSTTTIGSRELALLPAAGLGTAANPAARVVPDSVWLRITSQRGDNVKVRTNGAGDPLKTVTIDALGRVDSTVIGYQEPGHPSSIWSTSGTRLEYGWNGPLLTRIVDNVAGVTTELRYNSLGQDTATYVNQLLQNTKHYSADVRSVLESVTIDTAVTHFTYDARGRALTGTDGANHQTTFTYHPSGFQNVATTTTFGHTTQFAYDAYGRPAGVTDALGQTSTVGYDLLNRPWTATAPGRGTSAWGYSDVAGIYTFTDGKAQQYTTIVDLLGQTVSTKGPASTTLADQYRYDSDGNLSSFTTRAGRTGQILHDLLGRDTLITASGASSTRIAYDTARKWTAYANAESIDTVFVDGDGRVTKQVAVRNGQTFNVVSTYGKHGNRQTLALNSPVWSISRWAADSVDQLLRPSFIGDFGGTGTVITYNDDQQPRTITLPTGTSPASRLKYTLSYGPTDRLQSSVANMAGDALSWSYHHDALDRTWLLAQGEGVWASVRSVDYDSAGRVNHWSDSRTVELPGQWICDDPRDESSCYMYYGTESQVVRDSTYTYDAVGNRTDLGAAVQAGNRLTSFNGYAMTYDDDGNLLTKAGPGLSQSFLWNGLGQLVSVTTNGTVTTFGYDGLGRRVRKTHNGVTTQYLYDGDNLVVQMGANGARQLEFSYYPGIDHPNAVRSFTTGATYWYATSQPGNVTALVNAFNQVVNRYEYTPFGQAISATEQIAQPFRFAGRELDAETGLYYNRARYYDPVLARFIAEDPIGLAGGVNPYAYAGNDPVNFSDPSGTDCTNAEALKITYTRNEDGDWVETRTCPAGMGMGGITVIGQLPSGLVPSTPRGPTGPTGPTSPPTGPSAPSGPGMGPSQTPPMTAAPPKTGPFHGPSCSVSAFSANLANGALVGSVVGGTYGTLVGASAGRVGGGALGGFIGTLAGAPTIIGAPLAAYAGTLGGGIAGAWAGAIVGVHAGAYAGAGLGMTAAGLATGVLCAVGR